MPLIRDINEWVDSRFGISGRVGATLTKPVPGGARYVFTLGSLNVFLFINQFITGIFLMIYYVPYPDQAFHAVRYIQNEASMGFLVRGMHYWGASAMIVTVLLHAIRVFYWGAYKKPRELMWLTGVLLLLIVFVFAFTGYLLPWDQKAYWATVVGTNIPGTAPVMGGEIVRLLRGGPEITYLTLTRFFTVHVMILPWTFAIVAGMHLLLQQLVEHTPPWDPDKAKATAPFYPDQVFKDMVAAIAVFALLVGLANIAPAGLEEIADPTDKTYNPKPEWYFYFLFQLLHYTEGRFEIVGTLILPNLVVLLLFLVPFMDRTPHRSPLKRPAAMAGLAIFVGGYLALTVAAALRPSPQEIRQAASEGRRLYVQLGCGSCHSINGVGGKVGPPLDGVGDMREREWIFEHFRDPQKFVPGSVMPKYGYLTKEQLDHLTEYMLTLKQSGQ